MAADAASIAIGKRLYVRECLSCHGATGLGDGPAAKDLEKHPGVLSDRKMWDQSDGALYWKLKTGRTPMPSFLTLLSKTERWHVVNYIRTLAPREKPVEPRLAAPAAVRSGLTRIVAAYGRIAAALHHGNRAEAQGGLAALQAAIAGLPASATAAKGVGEAVANVRKSLASAAGAVAGQKDLAGLRGAFRDLSAALADAVATLGHGGTGPISVFSCPKAGGRGALWLQSVGPPQSPYLPDCKGKDCRLERLLGGARRPGKDQQKDQPLDKKGEQ